jgi:uncharacterized protein YbjT (DUF2867 family)
MPHKVILVGASGLIGSHLLKLLVESPEISEILVILRKPLNLSNSKVLELIINFEELESFSDDIKGDIIFCCLGTTKAATPDRKLYRKIDLEYPIRLATIGLKNAIKQFHIVSSLGADIKSSNSYLKLKGELEEKLKALAIESLHLYQPSLLSGNRKDYRPGEKLAINAFKFINPLLIGPLRKYRSIEAEKVALAMFKQSLKQLKGTYIYPSIQIQKLG